MKKIICVLLLILSNFAVTSAAELEPERERFICALSSAAAYQGEVGELAKSFFEVRNWKLDKFENPSKKINVKIHFMSKTDSDGEVKKVFFITGTEDLKDVGIDIKVKPVPLDESDQNILVHSGFKSYADAALSDGILNFVTEYINNHPQEKIYLTGHSLGGAIAMMIAVRLVDAGANMENVKVVTFGAPAIGNKNFAEKYKDKIHLTRAVMDSDIVDVSLNIFGYTHFGEVVDYKQVESSTQYSHAMSLYLDCAMRKFYDAGLKIDSQEKIKTPVYIAPIKIVRKSFKPVDESYVKEVLIDGYAARFANVTFGTPNFVEIKKAADFSYSVKEYIEAAKSSGSKFIIVPLIHTKPVRDAKQNTTRVLVEEIIFDSNGHLISMNTSGMTSKDVTILDAAFWGQEFLRDDREKTISK